MKTLDERHQAAVFGLMDEITGSLTALKCHCGARKGILDNECFDCDHYRTEAMQDDLETARRKAE